MMNPTQVAAMRLLCLAIASFLAFPGAEAFAERFQFQWSARLSLSEEYDDNIDLSAESKEHDWLTLVTPGLTLSLMTEETEASLSYDLSLVKYARNDERSGVRHSLLLSGFQGISIAEQATLDLDAELSITEDPFEIGNLEEGSTRSDPGRYYVSTLGGRVNYFFGQEDSVYGGFTHRLMISDEPGTDERFEYLPSAGLMYWFNIRYGFSLDYTYTKADFDVSDDFVFSDNYEGHLAVPSVLYRISPMTEANVTYTYDQLDYSGPRPGYTLHTFTLGLSNRFSDFTEGSVSGGYLLLDPENGDQEGNFTGSLSLTHTLPRGSVALDGGVGYRRQFFEEENLGLSFFTSASLTFTYQLQERLSARLQGSYIRDEYQETILDREQSNWGGAAGLEYTFLPWLDGVILYEYRQNESNIGLDDYEDHRATVRFTATYSGRPRPL